MNSPVEKQDTLLPPISRRLPELDVLRCAAILLVLGRHILLIPSSGNSLIRNVFLAWRNFGWIGVDLFFVLSGFLVGGLLLREQRLYGEIKPVLFLIRRGLKIYPSFYVFLALSLCVAHLVHLQFELWPRGLYGELFFLQNYVGSLWPQTWSLAVEEHFYLALVCFVAIARRGLFEKHSFFWLPRVVLAVNVFTLVGRLIAGYFLHVPWFQLLSMTHWRLDSLLFGVYLSYLYHFHRQFLSTVRHKLALWRFPLLTLLIGPCLLLDVRTNLYVTTVGFTTLYLGFGWILVDLLFRSSQKPLLPLISAGAAMIGRHSYSIYLWHFTIYYALTSCLRHFAPISFIWETLAYMSLSIGWGILMSVSLEQPVLRWRNRNIPSRNTALSLAKIHP